MKAALATAFPQHRRRHLRRLFQGRKAVDDPQSLLTGLSLRFGRTSTAMAAGPFVANDSTAERLLSQCRKGPFQGSGLVAGTRPEAQDGRNRPAWACASATTLVTPQLFYFPRTFFRGGSTPRSFETDGQDELSDVPSPEAAARGRARTIHLRWWGTHFSILIRTAGRTFLGERDVTRRDGHSRCRGQDTAGAKVLF